MSALTIRLSEQAANEVNIRAKKLHISRSEYVRRCIENMNKTMYKQERKERLRKASMRVRKESMRINSEFSIIEHDPEN